MLSKIFLNSSVIASICSQLIFTGCATREPKNLSHEEIEALMVCRQSYNNIKQKALAAGYGVEEEQDSFFRTDYLLYKNVNDVWGKTMLIIYKKIEVRRLSDSMSKFLIWTRIDNYSGRNPKYKTKVLLTKPTNESSEQYRKLMEHLCS